eukprot:Skav202662  [mRNA]  locus=scaffold1791:244592:245672:+ [translate_table: standard]
MVGSNGRGDQNQVYQYPTLVIFPTTGNRPWQSHQRAVVAAHSGQVVLGVGPSTTAPRDTMADDLDFDAVEQLLDNAEAGQCWAVLGSAGWVGGNCLACLNSLSNQIKRSPVAQQNSAGFLGVPWAAERAANADFDDERRKDKKRRSRTGWAVTGRSLGDMAAPAPARVLQDE